MWSWWRLFWILFVGWPGCTGCRSHLRSIIWQLSLPLEGVLSDKFFLHLGGAERVGRSCAWWWCFDGYLKPNSFLCDWFRVVFLAALGIEPINWLGLSTSALGFPSFRRFWDCHAYLLPCSGTRTTDRFAGGPGLIATCHCFRGP
jgi:hypothetical protein